MRYEPIPRSFGQVFDVVLGTLAVAVVVIMAENFVGSIVPDFRERKGSVCWFADDYIWPFNGWSPKFTCVATTK